MKTNKRVKSKLYIVSFFAIHFQLFLSRVHSRSAGGPTFNLLKESGATYVLQHACDGRETIVMEDVQPGYYIDLSIPPSIVRSEQDR